MTGDQLALRAEIFRAFAETGSPPDVTDSAATMRLLRSEEAAEGETVALTTLVALARDWYGDRLDPAWRPRSAEESQPILDAHGLTGEFWRLG